MPRAAREEVAAPHIWEQTNGCLWHGHLGTLSHNSQRTSLADAHATAHDDAIHKGNVGLAVGVDEVVELVFLGEEILNLRIAFAARLVQKANIATGTKSAKRPLFVAPTNSHGQDLRIVAPGQQHTHQVTHHTQRQGIQCLGTVQSDTANLATHFSDDIACRLCHVVLLENCSEICTAQGAKKKPR